jgi:hypothetical protein
MRNRHERRKAAATNRKKVARLNTATLDQHFDDVLRRARAEFERTGAIRPVFECVADGESFDVPAHWPARIAAKAAACAALRDSFRRRGVNRYVFASECWVGKTPGLPPADDPDRGEGVHVIAVERKGPRRYAFAGITRNAETATLGPWEVKGDIPPSWLFELLEDGHSDRALKTEPPPVGRIDLQGLLDQRPEHAAELLGSFELRVQLEDLIADQVGKDANGDPMDMFMALESVLLSIVKDMGIAIVKDMGIAKGFEGLARSIRDHPDKYPMFSTVPEQVVSSPQEHFRSYKAALKRFRCEKGEVGPAIFAAFVNMYLHVGSQVIGALNLADRIEDWDPAHQAKLRQVGLRSSFELDDEEGNAFIATSAGYYPIGVMGRRNAVGDLFVSSVIAFPQSDFATAVEEFEKSGFELILGSEAKELLCKMQQVKGFAMPAAKSKKIWEVEDWGADEWAEQFLAEIAFSMAMNVQYLFDGNKLDRSVAGYQVRRAPNGLVLVPSDNDEDIFVAVKHERTEEVAYFLGWLRGSEGKLPQFYQKNRWVIPPEALHHLEELPGEERLQAMPPFQEREARPPFQERATGPLGDSLEDLK